MDRLFQPAGATVSLTVSGSVEVFSIHDKPLEALIGQIDSCVAIQTRNHQY
ncbi:MAG: hypothetical protein ABSC23_16295 [Bryobacteraceae bacterium]